jgi:hypothetical protein
MADIGLNPPTRGNVHSREVVMTDALAKFGYVVKSAANGNHADCVTTATPGDTNMLGVIQSQGDPNNSALFAVGDTASCRDSGDAQVAVKAATYAVGTPLISSATAGLAKALAAETGADIIGYSRQAITTSQDGQLISMMVQISRRGS